MVKDKYKDLFNISNLNFILGQGDRMLVEVLTNELDIGEAEAIAIVSHISQVDSIESI